MNEHNLLCCGLLQLWIRWILSLSGFGIALSVSVVIVVGFSVVIM